VYWLLVLVLDGKQSWGVYLWDLLTQETYVWHFCSFRSQECLLFCLLLDSHLSQASSIISGLDMYLWFFLLLMPLVLSFIGLSPTKWLRLVYTVHVFLMCNLNYLQKKEKRQLKFWFIFRIRFFFFWESKIIYAFEIP